MGSLATLSINFHLDKHLVELVGQFGLWTYAILFAIIFCETGLVVTPIPGDSPCPQSGLSQRQAHSSLSFLLSSQHCRDTRRHFELLGGLHNWPGRCVAAPDRWLNRKHLNNSQFYEKYGGKTIIIARFIYRPDVCSVCCPASAE
jgi:membrane-associated protein